MAAPATAIVMRALVASLCAACGTASPGALLPPDAHVALGVADELERRGQWDLARDQLLATSEHAGTAERSDSILLRRCALWAREGLPRRARICYRDVRLASDEMRALRDYRLAVLEADLGALDVARDAMVAVSVRYPGTDGALRSLRGARVLARELGGPASEADLLLRVAEALREPVENGGAPAGVRDLYLEALVLSARVRLEELDDSANAEVLLARAVSAAEGSNWHDDAMIWRARALAALGRHDEALEHYQRIVDDRETAWFFGSYDSLFLDDALFEQAELLEKLHRPKEARDRYLELARAVPSSSLVDDAAFRAARLAGDRAALESFLGDYPESRHVRAARQLLENR